MPFVNHYSFHIWDAEWGHITIKMSGHPPFGAQIIPNGHEYVARGARKNGIELQKEGKCFIHTAYFNICTSPYQLGVQPELAVSQRLNNRRPNQSRRRRSQSFAYESDHASDGSAIDFARFTASEVAGNARSLVGLLPDAAYGPRQAAYDIKRLKRGRHPIRTAPIDAHYAALQHQMRSLF